jgi:hypothetical protein
MRRNWAAVACLSARLGLEYLYVQSEVETIYATQREERGMKEREKLKLREEAPAGDRPRGVVCEASGNQKSGSE